MNDGLGPLRGRGSLKLLRRYFTMVLYKICKKTASSFTLISDIGIGYKSFGIYNRCYYRMDWFHTFLQV